MNAEIGKLDINKLTSVPTSLNNLKTRVDDLDVGKLKTVPIDLSDVVDKEVIKNTKFNTLKTTVNNLDTKTSDASTLIHINHYKTDKQNLERKSGDVYKKNSRYKWFSNSNVLNTTINENEKVCMRNP